MLDFLRDTIRVLYCIWNQYMLCFMQNSFESNNFMAPVWFSCVKFHDTLIYRSSGMWRMKGNMALYLTGCHTCSLSHISDCAGFSIHLHNREYLHQIYKGFGQKNMQSHIFKLYIRQIEKSGKATFLNRYIRNKELRKRGDWEWVRNVRGHCHLQWKFLGLGNLACKSLNYYRKTWSF